jgi:hypothetical protein
MGTNEGVGLLDPPSPHAAIVAARNGDVAGLARWLDAGNDPNEHDPGGWTPLLWAAARGHGDAVRVLLAHGADPMRPHLASAARPIHMAGQSGDVATAALLLEQAPDQLNAVWDLNGHTLLLQAVFYGHVPLVRACMERGARTDITTARGLGPLELAAQFQNQEVVDLIRPRDAAPEAKQAYYAGFLRRIAPEVPAGEEAAQALADRLVDTIAQALRPGGLAGRSAQGVLSEVRALVEEKGADVNRLGGPLQQPSLVVAVTGNDGLPPDPTVARLRLDLAAYLLEQGADPTTREKHPMGAQTIIRAAVFNHLEILRLCGQRLPSDRLADAINEVPLVNGLTAMHDTVLRATMAAQDRFPSYLAQMRWFLERGGRVDIEDFAGVTQRQIAERCQKPDVRRQLLAVMDEFAKSEESAP